MKKIPTPLIIVAVIFAVLVLGSFAYFYFFKTNSMSVPDAFSNTTKPESTLPLVSLEGTYRAQYGVGTITITSKDETHILVSGDTILAGPGNTAGSETVKERSGNIHETILIQNNEGTLHPDPSDSTCSLTIVFKKGSLEVSGGDQCDATIENFDGTYTKN